MLGRREIFGMPAMWWLAIAPAALLGAAGWLPGEIVTPTTLLAYALAGLWAACAISFLRFELTGPDRPVVLMLARGLTYAVLAALAVALLLRLAL